MRDNNIDKTNQSSERQQVVPFLKWAGGKRWFKSHFLELMPHKFNRYVEPFLGSGAIFFSIRPQKAILSDVNPELIETYNAIKRNWKLVQRELKKHHNNHCEKYYYKIRESQPKSISSRAARLIYLNRTCWNGLYRVNKKGHFNVPIGTKQNVLLETDDFEGISNLLKRSQLLAADFENVIQKAGKDDLLFVDPPYTVKHSENGFIKYNENLFHWDDQVRLSECLKKAKRRGARIILTNANHDSIIELYRDEFKVTPYTRYSVIAADSENRKLCEELVIIG